MGKIKEIMVMLPALRQTKLTQQTLRIITEPQRLNALEYNKVEPFLCQSLIVLFHIFHILLVTLLPFIENLITSSLFRKTCLDTSNLSQMMLVLKV